jgi:hypothetical protein
MVLGAKWELGYATAERGVAKRELGRLDEAEEDLRKAMSSRSSASASSPEGLARPRRGLRTPRRQGGGPAASTPSREAETQGPR